MSDTESLFQAVSDRDWRAALSAVHGSRGRDDEVAEQARAVLVYGVLEAIDGGTDDLSDDDLEKVLLLERAGALVLQPGELDRLAEHLVRRNLELPYRALRFARYRPDADACRAVIAQYATDDRDEVGSEHGRVTRLAPSASLDGRRSVFRSGQERTFFAAAQRVFGGMLVVPNAALNAAIDFEVVRAMLGERERKVFFTALIDVVVYDPADRFRPRWFLELDSPWHDDPKQSARDRVKEHILTVAGCDLTRIRTAGPLGLSGMQHLIERAVES